MDWKRVMATALVAFAFAVSGSIEAETSLDRCVAHKARIQSLSGAVLVELNGSTSMYAQGLTSGPGSSAISFRTRFNIGSATKMFTAVAVLQLAEAGKVSLNKPVGDYLSGLSPEASKVTLSQLLAHTSGLGDFFKPESRDVIQSARTLRDLLPLIRDEKPAFLPGSKYSYSNSGYLILGMVVERVAGVSFEDYLRKRVFIPAAMSSTSLNPGPSKDLAVGLTVMTIEAQAHSAPPGTRSFGSEGGSLNKSFTSQDRGNPAGGAFTTLSDIQSFFHALTSGRLLSYATLHRMMIPQAVVFKGSGTEDEMDHGLGLAMGWVTGHRWFGYAGGLPGVNAEMDFFPEDHAVIVVLVNRDPPAATRLYSNLASTIFDKKSIESCSQP